MHRCAEVHNAMSKLTGLQHTPSDQHVKLNICWKQCDNQDIEKFKFCVKGHDPSNVARPDLRSLSSGLTATDEDGINCDDAEAVGQLIQKQLHGVSVEEASIARKNQALMLYSLHTGVSK